MNTIFADFNAMTERDGVRLTTRGSQDDLRRFGIRLGDWVWLTDSELVVGARVDEDPYHGVVGTPDWETLVHLDDEASPDIQRIMAELQSWMSRSSYNAEDEAKIFQLLTQFDHFAPPLVRDTRPGYLAFRRAASLRAMGKPELALVEIEEARSTRPGHPTDDHLYLDLLRRVSPDRATSEANRFAEAHGTSAMVLAAAINILAESAEDLPEDQFAAEASRIAGVCEQFEHASGRPNISAALLSLVHFNRGMILLRLGRTDEARAALDLAHAIEPFDEDFIEATQIVAHDSNAREIASRVRSRPLSAA